MEEKSEEKKDRSPSVSGQFYSSNEHELSSDLTKLFKQEPPVYFKNVVGIISPHAGYLFSGQIAANAFQQIPQGARFNHIFVIGSSHNFYFDYASVYSSGSFITPLGAVPIDSLAEQLITEDGAIRYYREAHIVEHSIEVQLPFIQHRLGKETPIIPILIGTDNPKTCEAIATALRPYFVPGNLFIISTDFSHYPEYDDALKIDLMTAESIQSNDPEKLIKAIEDPCKKSTQNLSTCLCGWTSVLTLMYLAASKKGMQFLPISYLNSGDSGFGTRKRVVGYFSMALVSRL